MKPTDSLLSAEAMTASPALTGYVFRAVRWQDHFLDSVVKSAWHSRIVLVPGEVWAVGMNTSSISVIKAALCSSNKFSPTNGSANYEPHSIIKSNFLIC